MNQSKSISINKNMIGNYFDKLIVLMRNIDTISLLSIIQKIIDTIDHGGRIYVIGNGGSAAAASHWANDFAVGVKRHNGKPIYVSSLTDNIAILTAIANDYGYENVFLAQLQDVLKPIDMIVAMSVSGNSKNVIEAVKYGNDVGAETIGITGFDGGILKDIVSIGLHIESKKGEYGPVEDIFGLVGHLVPFCLRQTKSEN